MNFSKRHSYILAFVILLFGLISACQNGDETLYYSAETNGQIFGYSKVTIRHERKDGKSVMILDEKIVSRTLALGAEVDTKISSISQISSETGQFSTGLQR